MDKKVLNEAIERLRSDEDYYGEFGRQFRSNSDISTLLTNPLALGAEQKPNINFLIGGYFHTAILEPDKLKKSPKVNAAVLQICSITASNCKTKGIENEKLHGNPHA